MGKPSIWNCEELGTEKLKQVVIQTIATLSGTRHFRDSTPEEIFDIHVMHAENVKYLGSAP